VRKWADVSEGRITSTLRVENQPSDLLYDDFLLGWFSALKVEVISSSEISAHLRTTWGYVPEDGNILKCYKYWFINLAVSFPSRTRIGKFNFCPDYNISVTSTYSSVDINQRLRGAACSKSVFLPEKTLAKCELNTLKALMRAVILHALRVRHTCKQSCCTILPFGVASFTLAQVNQHTWSEHIKTPRLPKVFRHKEFFGSGARFELNWIYLHSVNPAQADTIGYGTSQVQMCLLFCLSTLDQTCSLCSNHESEG
jgi:hypothetical protein